MFGALYLELMTIYSWNVNGIRAVTRKGDFQKFIAKHQPDILCLQETKAEQHQSEIDLPDYEEYWNSASKKGYSGTAIFTKIKPLAVINGLPQEIAERYGLVSDAYGDPQSEGRVIAAEFDKFFLVTVYTPNAKDDLSRIPLRFEQWDPAFLAYCKGLESGAIRLDGMQGAGEQQTEPYMRYGEGAAQPATQQTSKSNSRVSGSARNQAVATNRSGKPVVFCGDLNVAHQPEDLARPKQNEGKKGFTKEEREGFQKFIDSGFIDTFRVFTKDGGHYSWWTHWANARERNVGWRIDYILVSKVLMSKVLKAEIHADVMGSDHCPVSIKLDI